MERRSLPAPYKSTLYRSHLEARWAIFFDALGLAANYEPQGFDLGDGVAYLPDFAIYAARGTAWAEVKPIWDADSEGVAKWRRFAAMRPSPRKSRAVLLVGPPSTDSKHVVIGGDDTQCNPTAGPWEDDGQTWRPCSGGYHFDLAYPGQWHTRFVEDGCPDCYGGDGAVRIEAAVSAALSYRFGKFGPQSGKAA